MSRDDPHPPEPAPQPPSDGRLSGRLRTTGLPLITSALVVGLVVGWALRPLSVWRGTAVPDVSLRQVALLYFVAAVLAWVAWATHAALQRPRRHAERAIGSAGLAPHQAVNRLVLAKACALAGCGVAGGYLGHALSWVGIGSDVAGERIGWSLVAAGGAVLVVVTALLLERACRVRTGDEQS